MNLNFDPLNVTSTEFGVGRGSGDEREYISVPVDTTVQDALIEMVTMTWDKMQNNYGQNDGNVPPRYEPSEKYESNEYVYIEATEPMVKPLANLHKADNLQVSVNTMQNLNTISCYFVRLTDNEGNRLTGLRQATYFKGVLNKKLIRIIDDALMLLEDKVFKLDNDFDLLIDSDRLHIWRPKAFEILNEMKQSLLDAAQTHIDALQQEVPNVDFGAIGIYASSHPRAARYLASIRKQNIKDIDSDRLRDLCDRTGVEYDEVDGKMNIGDKHIMGFLEILDRRRYGIELIQDSPEFYKAASRQKLRISR
ncbi:MAG: DUF4868 domain-containing protein [Gammaproteobacteria bacterium]|nr:DUF4868 domain-containing protein [Gammaproteobacteria bacterium]